MAKKPTTSDAHLILELYDLRREAEMRKARNWFAGQFFPQSADDFLKVAWAIGTQDQVNFRVLVLGDPARLVVDLQNH